jgi:transcriptional regulator with XRE-family HTH domain
MAKKRETIGGRLTKARTEKGLSQADLATAAGLDRGAIRLIENGGRKNPQVQTIGALARVLGVSTDWLITGADGTAVAKATG